MKEKNVKKKHGYVFDIHTWKPVINYNMIDFYMGGRKALTISTNQSRKMQELLIDFCIEALVASARLGLCLASDAEKIASEEKIRAGLRSVLAKAGIRFVEFYEPLSVSERRCAYGSN
jgi:hypothetical protein